MGWFILFVAFLLVAVVVTVVAQSKRRKVLADALNSVPGFSVSQHFAATDGSQCIAIDEAAGLICFIRSVGGAPIPRVFAAKDVLSSEIFEDGDTVTKSVRSSQVAGALVGGVLLGGAGVLIGALSGKKRSQSKVNAITLRVTVNDTRTPVQEVRFLFRETSRDGILYQSASKLALHWQALMDILIKRAEGSLVAPAVFVPVVTPQMDRE
jgi:hypothetical protein